MEKWFSTDYSAKVGRILMIFWADPHEISILMKCCKNSPLGKTFRTQKTDCESLFLFSEVQELKVQICVQPNFPSIILLTGFHNSRNQGVLTPAKQDVFYPYSDIEDHFKGKMECLSAWIAREDYSRLA